MARSKQKGITSLDPKKLPDGITVAKIIRRTRETKDEEGNVVPATETLVEVPRVLDASGIVALQEHVTENGPEKYDGNVFVRDLINGHLSSFAFGEEISTAPTPRYVDPAEVVQRQIDERFAAVRRGDKGAKLMTQAELEEMYKAAGLM